MVHRFQEAAEGGAVKKTHIDDEPEGPSERDRQMAEQIEKFRVSFEQWHSGKIAGLSAGKHGVPSSIPGRGE